MQFKSRGLIVILIFKLLSLHETIENVLFSCLKKVTKWSETICCLKPQKNLLYLYTNETTNVCRRIINGIYQTFFDDICFVYCSPLYTKARTKILKCVVFSWHMKSCAGICSYFHVLSTSKPICCSCKYFNSCRMDLKCSGNFLVISQIFQSMVLNTNALYFVFSCL